jgi:dihydroflavonol-4-reductase
MKRALVTGGCGFLGSSIVKALIGRGVAVRVLALPNEPTDNVKGLDLELVRGDILSLDDAKKAVAGVDTVFHAAAIYKAWVSDPTSMYKVNSSGTFNVLEAARQAGVQKVVYTASIVSLGRPQPGTLGDEATPYDAWNIDFPYSRSKFHSRELAEDFAHWGLDLSVVCPGVVLGPGDIVPTPSGKIIINTLKGAPPLYMDGGASYVDVRDAAEVHLLAAEKGGRAERYIATAHNLDNGELLTAITRAAGSHRRFFKLPVGVARKIVNAMNARAQRTNKEPPLTKQFFEYSLKPSFYSNAKAVRELGARFRPFDETLRDAIAYFRERGAIRA